MQPRTDSDDRYGRHLASARAIVVGPIIASIAFVLELTLVPLLLPLIQQHFGLSIGQLAWVFNAYGLAVALGVLVSGWLGDNFQTRVIFMFGSACFALGSCLVAIAGSFEALIIGRALQGFGGGIFSPLIPLLLTRASPGRPGWMLIVWGSVTGYVAAIAPLVYSRVLDDDGWQTPFLFFAILTATAVVILLGSRSSPDQDPEPERGGRLANLLRARDLWLMFCYVFCTYGAITFYLFRLPVSLSDKDFSSVSVGFLVSILWLSFAFLSTLLRNRVDKPHINIIMLAAPVLIATALSASFGVQTVIGHTLTSILLGAGLACSNAPSTHRILRLAPKGMSALSSSLDITFARLGGVATVGFLASAEGVSASAAIFVLSLVAFLCALIAARGQGTDTSHDIRR